MQTPLHLLYLRGSKETLCTLIHSLCKDAVGDMHLHSTLRHVMMEVFMVDFKESWKQKYSGIWTQDSFMIRINGKLHENPIKLYSIANWKKNLGKTIGWSSSILFKICQRLLGGSRVTAYPNFLSSACGDAENLEIIELVSHSQSKKLPLYREEKSHVATFPLDNYFRYVFPLCNNSKTQQLQRPLQI